MSSDRFLDLLHQYWGYPDFRGIQRQIIDSIAAGRDTLGLMPTGGGKSLTFQVPALAAGKVCLVVTPLIALMKDQVIHLRQRGIKAAAVYSGMSHQEILSTLENAVYGGVTLLYVSPERLQSELFQVKLRHMKVSFITVDEAHCISQWGYDFRPSYLHITDIRALVPDAPILALTATATPEVVDDIQDKLQFRERNVFRMSYERKNLSYVVRHTMNKDDEAVHILRSVPGTAIVYVRSRKKTKEIAQMLTAKGITASAYHAGMERSSKDTVQKAWLSGETRVIVATNAFGMGIDKPDVRLVIHMDCPDSIEAYFQEAGRAGRDGQKAYAVLLYNGHDTRTLLRRIPQTFPPKEFIRKVYDDLAYFFQIGVNSGAGTSYLFNLDSFCRIYNHYTVPTDSALRILMRAGYIDYQTDPDDSTRVIFTLERHQLYSVDTTPREDLVITTLLRTYGGLFTDYVYIDINLLAMVSGLSKEEIYLTLKELSHRGILNFIPQRSTPLITYTTDRIDSDRLVISKEVYEMRKEQYEKRIDAIIRYATSKDICRSKQLLSYFGEINRHDCGICDVCVESRQNPGTSVQADRCREQLLALFSDKKSHSMAEVRQLDLPTEALYEVLHELMAEEVIQLDEAQGLRLCD